jgi:hypothetical protein
MEVVGGASVLSCGECKEVYFPSTRNTLSAREVTKMEVAMAQTLKFCIACFQFRTENNVPEMLAC